MTTSPTPPVLFLDFDGVLNSDKWFRQTSNAAEDVECGMERNIDPEAVRNLNRIIESTGCQVVISSTWRRGNTIATLLRLLVKRGLDKKHSDRFIGATPVLDSLHDSGLWIAPVRGEEIQAWLDGNPEVERFVIVDDDPDMAHLAPHLVQTKILHGLTAERADAAINHLNGSSQQSKPKTK
jgi:hypothetical protein